MNYIYLDLNVFDQIEKIERLTPEQAEPYQLILNFLHSGELTTVYSDAHIHDLIRGYNNSQLGGKDSLNGHLQNLSSITNNLCMCLYGQQTDIKVDYRDIFDFFNSSLEDSLKYNETSFSGLISSITNNNDIEVVEKALETTIESMNILLQKAFPEDMMKAFEFPIYQKMFPKTYLSGNMSSMFDDMLTLNERISKDPEMYRDFKRMMNPENISEFVKVLPEGKTVDKKELKETLKKYDFESLMETYVPKNKTSENEWYDKITNLYSQIDFKGYKTDKEFANMIDDSKHTFYGAHCQFFITNDTRCHYKAKEVYRRLNIGTLVFTPVEFLEYVKTTR